MTILFSIVILFSQAVFASVVIDCTFPCKISTEACVVTATTIKCAPISNNQWILRSRNSIPVFQGTLAGISQNCQSVPFPTLTNSTVINSTETMIEWPPVNTRNPYDKYLGNCESNAFCSDQLVCTQRYTQGHYCESTHQCVQGSLCTEYTCQVTSPASYTESGGLNTIHIIAAIVGVVLAIVVLLAIYLFRRRRNRKLEDAIEKDTNESSNTSSNTQVITILPYESHFENTSSPSQELHSQRHAYQDHKGIAVPPPPYSP